MSILLRALSNVFRAAPAGGPARAPVAVDPAKRCVLDVGSGSRQIPLPAHYGGWARCLLDIDSAMAPDIVLDARELNRLEPAQFDAVYCSHNLEHYYAHEVKTILGGFVHVLKLGGFVEIRVPDIAAVARAISSPGGELDAVLYNSPAGPITARDIIYGLESWIAKSGSGYFAHKTGFTRRTLELALRESGLDHVHWLQPLGPYEIHAAAMPAPADAFVAKTLHLDGAQPPE